MKHFYLILLSLLPLAAFSQSTLYFSYDASGNQILRNVVCINCGSTQRLQNNLASNEKIIVSEESMVASPNPVTHKLRVRWVYNEANPLQVLQLRNANGSLLQNISIRSNVGQTELDLSSYLPGWYLLIGIGANGKTTTIKIIRQ